MKTHQGDDDNRGSLPLDMMIEVLIKLPAKSLFRFRCVSKQWCSIIRSRSFIDSFMSLSLSRPRFFLGYSFIRGNERRLLLFSSPLHPQDSNHRPIVSKNDMPHLIISHCNSVRGIICLRLENLGFVLCNPTTRQVISLPNDPTGLESEHNICFMSLGYDKGNDQYKILRTMKSTIFGSAEHSVCTLRVGGDGGSSFSSWRSIESSIQYFCKDDALCINGVVYYRTFADQPTRFVIVSFDVGSERLLVMEAPKEEKLVDPIIYLIEYQGKLACFCVANDDNTYSLWILDDVKKQIWSKACVFSPSFCDSYRNLKLRLCGTTKAGEIIFVSILTAEGGFDFFYWDLKKNNVSRRARIGDIAEHEELRCLLSINVLSIYSSCDHVENIISL